MREKRVETSKSVGISARILKTISSTNETSVRLTSKNGLLRDNDSNKIIG